MVAVTSRVLAGAVLGALMIGASGCPCGPGRPQVVVYTSVDQVYSEPILRAFDEEAGIAVLPVFDAEAAKTTGLANRLRAEAAAPQADVWWNGEFAQTLALQEQGILAPYRSPEAEDIPTHYRDPEGYWTGLAGRARVILANTDLVAEADLPRSRRDLLDPRWGRGQIGIAYPLFGTTATEAGALYAALGPAAARAFYERLRDSGARVVDGNSVVRDLVAAGQLKAGLTDSDDAAVALAQGAPVRVIVPDQDDGGTLVIPGTVALIAGAPHPEQGRALVDFLVSRATERRLIAAGFSQIPLRAEQPPPPWLADAAIKPLDVQLAAVQAHLAQATGELRGIFVR